MGISPNVLKDTSKAYLLEHTITPRFFKSVGHESSHIQNKKEETEWKLKKL